MTDGTRPDEVGYRRGVVLGLTMAEVMILVLFCLLMTTLIVFEEQEDKIDQLQKERAIKGVPMPDGVVELIEKISGVDLRENVVDEEFTRLVETLTGLREIKDWVDAENNRAGEPHELISDAKQLKDLVAASRNTVVESGQLGRNWENVRKGLDAIKSGLSQMSDDEKKRLLGSTAVTAEEKRKSLAGKLCEEQFSDPKLQEQCVKKVMDIAGGKGLEFKSCWWDKSVVPYATKVIYDVALKDEGFLIRDVDPGTDEYRTQKEKELPVAAIVTGVPIDDAQLLASTRALYKWSVEHDCRFYVRVFDETLPTSKDVYKKRLAVLETHFYKQLTERRF